MNWIKEKDKNEIKWLILLIFLLMLFFLVFNISYSLWYNYGKNEILEKIYLKK